VVEWWCVVSIPTRAGPPVLVLGWGVRRFARIKEGALEVMGGEVPPPRSSSSFFGLVRFWAARARLPAARHSINRLLTALPVSPTAESPQKADLVFDLIGQKCLPGLVNTHHHLHQTLFRNLPAAQIEDR
jgi:hypothetical protein